MSFYYLILFIILYPTRVFIKWGFSPTIPNHGAVLPIGFSHPCFFLFFSFWLWQKPLFGGAEKVQVETLKWPEKFMSGFRKWTWKVHFGQVNHYFPMKKSVKKNSAPSAAIFFLTWKVQVRFWKWTWKIQVSRDFVKAKKKTPSAQNGFMMDRTAVPLTRKRERRERESARTHIHICALETLWEEQPNPTSARVTCLRRYVKWIKPGDES